MKIEFSERDWIDTCISLLCVFLLVASTSQLNCNGSKWDKNCEGGNSIYLFGETNLCNTILVGVAYFVGFFILFRFMYWIMYWMYDIYCLLKWVKATMRFEKEIADEVLNNEGYFSFKCWKAAMVKIVSKEAKIR